LRIAKALELGYDTIALFFNGQRREFMRGQRRADGLKTVIFVPNAHPWQGRSAFDLWRKRHLG
jgi:hypothetical protein